MFFKANFNVFNKNFLPAERVTQSVLKSHIETSQYSTEELKRMAWTLYSPDETRSYQTKVSVRLTTVQLVQQTDESRTALVCIFKVLELGSHPPVSWIQLNRNGKKQSSKNKTFAISTAPVVLEISFTKLAEKCFQFLTLHKNQQ